MSSASDLAAGKWASVLTQLGLPPEILNKRHHPCPNGDGKDRFRFADRNGSGNYFCSCSQGDKGGMALLMCCKGWTYAEAARAVERVAGQSVRHFERTRGDPRVALNRVRQLCQPIGFAVTRYLHERGLKPPPGLREARLTYWDNGTTLGVFATMVGLIMGPDGKPQSYHLTYLDGIAKANVPSPRKVMTPVDTITGGAIQLYPPAPRMGVAEGIETAIAAFLLTGIPTWAAANAHGVETFQPLALIEHLTIFADHDDSFTGQAAAFALAKRLRRGSIKCEVATPTKGDWNDELLRGSAQLQLAAGSR